MPGRDVRAEAEATLAALIDDEDDPTFEAPWQARAFAITVALAQDGEYDWEQFQERFIDRIQSVDEATMQRDVEQVYYEEWLATVEELLVESGTITDAAIERRQAEFEAGERESSEFVVERLPEERSSR